MVVDLKRGSAATCLGFRVGDILRAVNGEKVDDIAGLKPLLSARAERWLINIDRKGKSLNLVING